MGHVPGRSSYPPLADSVSCPFCRLAADPSALAPLSAYEDLNVFAVPSLEQKLRNRGHTLVVTRDHIPTIYDLPTTLAGPLMRAVSAVARAVKTTTGCEGVTIRQNNARAGGQDVFHLHVHVIPRWTADRYFTFDTPFQVVSEEERRVQALLLREEMLTAEA